MALKLTACSQWKALWGGQWLRGVLGDANESCFCGQSWTHAHCVLKAGGCSHDGLILSVQRKRSGKAFRGPMGCTHWKLLPKVFNHHCWSWMQESCNVYFQQKVTHQKLRATCGICSVKGFQVQVREDHWEDYTIQCCLWDLTEFMWLVKWAGACQNNWKK